MDKYRRFQYVTYRFLDNDPVITIRGPLVRCIGQMYLEVGNALGLTGNLHSLKSQLQLTAFNGQRLTPDLFCFLSDGDVVEVILKGQYSKYVLFSPNLCQTTFKKTENVNAMLVDQREEEKSSQSARCKRKLELLFTHPSDSTLMTDDETAEDHTCKLTRLNS